MTQRTMKYLWMMVLLATCVMYAPVNFVRGETALKATAKSFSCMIDQRASYQIILTFNDLKVEKYLIEREEMGNKGSRVKVAEVSYAEMAQKGFQYMDSTDLVKHGRYRYYLSTLDENGKYSETVSIPAIVQNITVPRNTADYLPVFSQNTATFTLGPKVDPENETLEYRLYTRILGGGGEKPLQTWIPSSDHEQVIVNFMETCEWKLVCIETDRDIPDRMEIVLVNWCRFIAK